MKFLREVARCFYERDGEKIGELCFVFPNRRSGLFFQKYLGEMVEKPLFSPAIFTIKDLILSLSRLREADTTESLFLLYSLYLDISGSQESFDEFVYWGEIILNDFNDTDKFLADPKKLFANIKDLKEIESDYSFLSEDQLSAVKSFWEGFLPEGDSDSKQKFKMVWEVLYPLYLRFREELQSRSCGYQGMIYREVAENPKLLDSLSEYRQIVFVGMNALNECEKSILRSLKNRGVADFYWDYFSPMVQDPQNRASQFINYNLSNFPSSIEIDAYNHQTPQIEIIGVASSVIQTKIVSQILDRCSPGMESAVILPDERLLMPLLHSIPENFPDVNVTMGYPLRGTPLLSLIELVVSLKEESRGYYHKRALPILRHSYVKLISPIKAKAIYKRVVQENLIYAGSELFEGDELLERIFSHSEDMDSSALCDKIVDVLSIVSTHKEIDKIEREFIYHLHATVTRIKGILIPMSSQTFGRLLMQLIGGVTIPFRGEPLSGLQVMGVLETRSLDFENIIYCSLNEGIFPPSSSSNSFIPYNLRRGFSLPVKEYDDAISSYLFYRSIYRAKRAYLIYDTRTEGLNIGEASRFILQLKYHYKLPIKESTVSFRVTSTKREEIVIEKSPKVMEMMMERFVNDDRSALSASALNKYIECPLSFYFSNVEGVEEEIEISEEVEANEFGSIFHDTMQKLYSPHLKQQVSDTTIENMARNIALIEKYVDEGFLKHKNIKQVKGYNLLIKRIIVKYVQQTLLYDSKSAPFLYLASERRVRSVLPVKWGYNVNLKGFIDRLDKKDILRIVDYKTGQGELKLKSIDTLFEGNGDSSDKVAFQMMLYALMLKGDKEFVFDGEVKIAPYFIRSLVKKGSSEMSINAEQIESFKERVVTLIEEIFDPSVPFTGSENEKVCKWCPYSSICFNGSR